MKQQEKTMQNDYALKGMLAELKESIKESKYDEVKNLCKMITQHVDGTVDNGPKDNNNNDDNIDNLETNYETKNFIKLVAEDNQEELFKIFEISGWIKKLDLNVIYDYFKDLKIRNDSVYHIMGYILGEYLNNKEKGKEMYLLCDKHPYALYNLHIISHDHKYLEESAKLGYWRAQYDMARICKSSGDMKTTFYWYKESLKIKENKNISNCFTKNELFNYIIEEMDSEKE